MNVIEEIKLPPTNKIVKLSNVKYYDSIQKGFLEKETQIETTVGKISIIKDIIFFPDGDLKRVSLSKSQKLNTSIGEIVTNKAITFHDNGQLKIVWPTEISEVDTPKGKAKIYDQIIFHRNGNIHMIILAEETVLSGITFEKDDVVEFTECGDLA